MSEPPNTIRIIGVPMDLGQSHRGVDMGPGAVRYAGLASRLTGLGYKIQDVGNIEVPVRTALHKRNRLPAIKRVCEEVYQAGKIAAAQKINPIFLGGDHSIAIGTIGGVTHASPVGVIWIDAHGDFNTAQTSKTGNVHGMALAVLTGHGFSGLVNIGRPGPKVPAKNIVMIGIRELDREEKKQLRESGIAIFTMRDIDERGISAVAHDAVRSLSHLNSLHISLDVDSIDPMVAPGVGTPVPGGLTYREAQLLMEIIADTQKAASLDIVEINPLIDQGNRTAEIAVDLAASLFGKRIL